MYESFYGLSSKPFQLNPDPTFYFGSKQHRRAKAYLDYLYSAEGQNIAARHYYRPRDAKVAAQFAKQFAPVKLVTIDEVFGGWQKAQKTHFADGGVFDQIAARK